MERDHLDNPGESADAPGPAVIRRTIRTPELLHVETASGPSYGANQIWYPAWFARMAGCGPTTASNLLWYLTASRKEECGGLFRGNACEQAEMILLMRAVWRYVKPGRRGVDKASILANGAVRYGAERGVPLRVRVLEVPETAAERPAAGAVLDFLTAAFSDDLPVAFLNLSNGTLKNLDNWHWVTLVSTDAALQAEMYDQSRRQFIDLRQWLSTTTMGGAFVVIEPK